MGMDDMHMKKDNPPKRNQDLERSKAKKQIKETSHPITQVIRNLLPELHHDAKPPAT